MTQNIQIGFEAIKTPTNTPKSASNLFAKMRAGQEFTVDEILSMPRKERIKIVRLMWQSNTTNM